MKAKAIATDSTQAPGPRVSEDTQLATPRASGPRSDTAAAQPPQTAKADKVLSVLYLFSGVPRQHDMTSCLKALCELSGYKLSVHCVDIKRKPRVDLSYSKQRKKILGQIKSRCYDAILLSPPCSTFSRAPWANKRGPRPVRDFDNPRGLDSLSPAERDRAILGNIFADFSYDVISAALDVDISFLLLEQPEDLGAMRYGPYQGRRPASMWQWPQLPDILRRAGMLTCVFHQGNLGAGYPKPTRLLLRTRLQLPSFCFVGPPTFDSNGFYKGPLPLAKGMGSIRSQHTSGPFKTSGTECWPARMCQWIASLLVSSWEPPATTATLETSAATQESPERDTSGLYPVCQPEGARLRGGEGPPRSCDILEGQKPFHDGGGLCFTGRWPHDRRILAGGHCWSWIRAKLFDIACSHAGGVKELEREAFRMATGGEDGCRLLRNQSYIADIVIALCEWLDAQDLG